MNNHKILWKRSIFKWIPMLLFVVPLVVPTTDNITYFEDVNFQFFDNEVKDIEHKIFESLQTTKNFFASEIAQQITLYELLAGSFIPVLQQAAGVAFVMRALLAEESDWKTEFSKTIAREAKRDKALEKVKEMVQSITTFKTKSQLLSETNPDMASRYRTASTFHTKFDVILNFFNEPDSLFKKYPLIGAPLLIEFALLIAYFEPMAKTLIPVEAKFPELSCKVRNILLDYRRHTVNARIEKLRLESSSLPDDIYNAHSQRLPQALSEVMEYAYHKHGYVLTNPRTIRCKEGCDKATTMDKLLFHEWTKKSFLWKSVVQERLLIPMRMLVGGVCLKDDYGTGEYLGTGQCIREYGLLVRHRIEELFPIELLSQLCADPPKEKEGYGWFTIKLREVRAYKKLFGGRCDLTNDCDPYVKLFINGKEELVTTIQDNTCCYDVGITYTSKYIHKFSLVTIEIWDSDNPIFGPDDLIYREETNIESLLESGYRFRDHSDKMMQNYIDTVSFWQDDYAYDELKIDKN